MGDIRKLKKKYSKPGHPWQKQRIEDEKPIVQEYGLKNKTEIWRTSSLLKSFSDQAKKLIAARGEQSEKEKSQLINKLSSLGLVPQNADLDDVLSITLKDVLNRRLQTIVAKKGFARGLKQSRQFISHHHIKVKNKTISAPSYLVHVSEESTISFDINSALSKENHPERVILEKTGEVKNEK